MDIFVFENWGGEVGFGGHWMVWVMEQFCFVFSFCYVILSLVKSFIGIYWMGFEFC